MNNERTPPAESAEFFKRIKTQSMSPPWSKSSSLYVDSLAETTDGWVVQRVLPDAPPRSSSGSSFFYIFFLQSMGARQKAKGRGRRGGAGHQPGLTQQLLLAARDQEPNGSDGRMGEQFKMIPRSFRAFIVDRTSIQPQTQSTDHDKIPPLKQSASANDTRSGSRKRDKLKTITDANAPWGHSGNLKEGTPPEGKGR
eukprot:scaffold36304_cov121-Isochrysis_galbana.AAC.14